MMAFVLVTVFCLIYKLGWGSNAISTWIVRSLQYFCQLFVFRCHHELVFLCFCSATVTEDFKGTSYNNCSPFVNKP